MVVDEQEYNVSLPRYLLFLTPQKLLDEFF